MNNSIFNCFAGKKVLFQLPDTIKETIYCARYLKDIEGSGGQFYVEDVHGLSDVFRLVNPSVSILGREETSKYRFDVIYSLSKLRFFMPKDEGALTSPYVEAPADFQKEAQSHAEKSGLSKVGLGLHNEDTNYRIKLSDLSHNLTIQQQGKTKFFSFTEHPAIEENPGKMQISQFSIDQHGFSTLICLLTVMDIIISLENTFAHLAGALGKPVWLLVPFGTDEKSVFNFIRSYPLVTVFRQKDPSDWSEVLQNIALLRLLQPKDLIFSPFNVVGGQIPMIDTLPLPDFEIESPDDLSELISADIGKLTNIQIETTSICNLRCPYCPNATVGRPAAYMQADTFYKIIDSLRDFNSSYSGSIAPHFYGEPLIDKRMEDFISYARKTFPKAYLEIYTNGELLTVDRYLSLKEAGVDIFKISQHTEMPSQILSHTLSYIKQNHPELFTVDFKIFYNTPNKLNRGGLVSESGVSEEVLKKVGSCSFAHRVMTFDYHGNALLCCNDYLSRCSFGNISESSISEIWNSSRYKKVRNLVVLGFLPVGLCRACIYGTAYQ